MEFMELAKSRYSVRSFKETEVEAEKIEKIIEAGRVAPTACNFQPQRIYVVKSKENKSKLATICQYTFNAPVIFVICYDKEKTWKNRLMPGYQSGETDASIVCTHMMLQAWELGIGSCWVGFFNNEEVSKVLNLPDNFVVSALLPIGYPSDNSVPSKGHFEVLDKKQTIFEI